MFTALSELTLARKLVYGFVTAIVLGVCAEVGARVDDYVREGIPLLAAPSYEELIVHDSLGSHGAPNGRFGDIRLNSKGFRSSEASLAPAPGCIRVMTLGSSETFGTGTTAGHEYPAQLEDSLSGHGCYRVINAAMVGMGVRSMITYWNSWASRFDPDIVVVLATPSLYLQTAPMAFPRQGPTNKPTPTVRLESRLLERTHDFIHYPDFIQRVRVQNHLDELTAGHSSGWFFSTVPKERLNLYQTDLDSLITAIRSAGAEPIVAEYPTRLVRPLASDDSALMAAWRAYSPRATPDVMLDFLAAGNAAADDLGRLRKTVVVDLPSRMNGHRELFVDFSHYTAEGAARVAGMIARAILSSHPVSAQTATNTVAPRAAFVSVMR